MGVPHGSILSATLLSIKINSLTKVLNDNIEGYREHQYLVPEYQSELN
jgi:hypothetical protein